MCEARFKYDPQEQVGDDDYLIPVYFRKQLLVRYFYDSRFTCDFVSETYGSISGDDFSISFGINSNGSVISWLGDLNGLPLCEQLYWSIENKEAEGDIHSEFYEAQMNCEFTDPPLLIAALNEIEKLNSRFHKVYGIHLYKERSIESRIAEAERYKRLIMNSQDDFKRFVSEINEIVSENTNNSELRALLLKEEIQIPSGSKGNKLLELVYLNILDDTGNQIAPFFYLYDLRLWADHTGMDGKLQDVANALGVPPTNYMELLNALVARIKDSAINLQSKINA